MIQVQATPGGTVVAFKPAGPKTKRPPDPPGTARGAVLFFTGVRYERSAEPQDRPEPRGPPEPRGESDAGLGRPGPLR